MSREFCYARLMVFGHILGRGTALLELGRRGRWNEKMVKTPDLGLGAVQLDRVGVRNIVGKFCHVLSSRDQEKACLGTRPREGVFHINMFDVVASQQLVVVT